MKLLTSVACASVLVSFCGCGTLTEEDRSMLSGMREDIRSLELQVTQANGRLDAVEAAQTQLREDVQSSRASTDAGKDSLESRVEGLDRAVKAVDKARLEDREEIVRQLSKKIVEVVRGERGTGSGTGAVTPPAGGSRHVVKQGETLTGIARTYGVTLDALRQANGINDASGAIRVGQTLTIPR